MLKIGFNNKKYVLSALILGFASLTAMGQERRCCCRLSEY